MDFDKYRRRLSRNGEDVGEVLDNNTLTFIDSKFHISPTFRVLKVFGDEFPDISTIDARVIEIERMGTLREVLFRPKQGLNIGTYVEFDGDIWLAYDKWGSIQSANLKVLIQKCNRILSWKDKNGAIFNMDCVASATPLGSKSNQGKSDIEWNKYDVRLPIGQLFVFVEAKPSTRDIEMNQRFVIGSKVYEIVGIDETTLVDKNSYGVIQFTVKVTTSRDEDDFTTGIADNKYDHIREDDDSEGGKPW